MFHSNTEQVLDYWRARRGDDEVPARASIDPAHLAERLPQIVMLERQGAGQYRVRLAGGFVADLYGRELRHADFLRLWDPAARTPLQLVLEAILRRPEPLVVEAEAQGGETRTGLEVLITPLKGPSGQLDRLLGFYQPTSPWPDLKGAAITALRVKGISTTAPKIDAFPRLRLAAIEGREIA
jgi:hypothetical protein